MKGLKIEEIMNQKKRSIQKLKDQYFAVCPHSTEELLIDEIKNIDIKSFKIKNGGVYFESTPEKAIELILKSRIASKVYKQLYTFDIKVEKDLYFFAKEIKWKALFSIDQTFKIDVSLGHSPDGFKRSKFTNSMYLGQVLKDGIVDRFREDFNQKRPSIDKHTPDIGLNLRIEPHDNKFSSKENVIISIDMCGELLSNRGYRIRSVEAPIRENLAAAMILMSELKKDENFYDPMCGSGTFLIEALLIMGNITPSFLKIKNYFDEEEEFKDQWAFLNHEYFVKNPYLKENTTKLLNELKESNEKAIELLKKNKIKVYGTDIDMNAIKACNINLGLAGLKQFAYLEQTDASLFSPPHFKGVIMANPPYGERLDHIENLENLYHQFGENLKQNFKQSRAYIYTSNLNLLKKISLQSKFRKTLHNANLEGRLVRYDLY